MFPPSAPPSAASQRFSGLFSPAARPLLAVKGADFISNLGVDATREVVAGVLGGNNFRDYTEKLTRRRLSLLNAALRAMLVEAERCQPSFFETFPQRALGELRTAKPAERPLLLWLLGQTQKGWQNIFRGDLEVVATYVAMYEETMRTVAAQSANEYGGCQTQWLADSYIDAAISAQSSSIRGSDKSAYGKLFEVLVLGGALHTLGLRYVLPYADSPIGQGAFWLSSRDGSSKEGRETDASALFPTSDGRGVGVRFDIGFIGEGNPEISRDKLSRYQKHVEVNGRNYEMHTVVLVDSIGAGSALFDHAARIDVCILEMRNPMWLQNLGDRMAALNLPGFHSPLSGLSSDDVKAVVNDRLLTAPFEQMVAPAR